MASYIDYINSYQQFARQAQAKDPAFQEWQSNASMYSADMGPAPAWTGTDYFDQWFKSLQPAQQQEYLQRLEESNAADKKSIKGRIGSLMKVIPAAVLTAGAAGAAGLLGGASGAQAAVPASVDAALAGTDSLMATGLPASVSGASGAAAGPWAGLTLPGPAASSAALSGIEAGAASSGAVPAAAGVYTNPAYAAIPGAAKVATGGATDSITSALTSQLGKSFLPVIGAALGGAAIGAASSGGGAPGTDPAVGTAISTNQELSKEQAGFTREQWAQQMAYLAKISPMFDAYAKSNLGNLAALDKQTGEQFSDYSTLYRPVQEAYIGDVMRAGSEAEQAAAAARAGAGVQTQLDVQREIDARNMASMGVSPESGRFSSDRVTSVLGAAARAGAENAARVTERDRGTTLKAQATGLGLNLANVAQQGVQVGNQTAGTGASVASVPFNLKQAGDAQFQAGLGSAGALNTAAGQLAADASRINTAGWVAKQGVTNQNLSGLGSLGAFLYKALG